jgi:hypothetical protein
MLQALRQDARFAYLEDVNDLLAALEDVARLTEDLDAKGAVTFPGTAELASLAGVNQARIWWRAPTDTELGQGLFDDTPPTLKLHVGSRLSIKGKVWVVAPQGEKGSAVRNGTVHLVAPERVGQEPLGGELLSMTVKELARLYGAGTLAAVDTLDTGEQQPRLPGDTGAARDAEVATPAFEAPFALTSEASTRKGKQTSLFQSAYHGSPHEFEKFSLHAIGTGEGAQAYGWGLYFASRRETAEYYRDTVSRHGSPGCRSRPQPIKASITSRASRAATSSITSRRTASGRPSSISSGVSGLMKATRRRWRRSTRSISSLCGASIPPTLRSTGRAASTRSRFPRTKISSPGISRPRNRARRCRRRFARSA